MDSLRRYHDVQKANHSVEEFAHGTGALFGSVRKGDANLTTSGYKVSLPSDERFAYNWPSSTQGAVPMSLDEVKEVQQVRDPRMVNEMIKLGWVLIDTNPGTMEDGSAWPLYILGWKHNRVAARVKQDW